MNYVYFDIETIPAQDAAVRERVAADLKPPANYKDPAKIEVWLEEHKDEAIAKTSFEGGLGRVCCICAEIGESKFSAISLDESDNIVGFFEWVEGHTDMPVLVGHNINGFDIPFLIKRCIVLGIQIPDWLPRDPKPWDDRTVDTMTAWAGSRNTVSLKNLCWYLGVEYQDDVDGSMVAQMYADHKYDEIVAYCCEDVAAVKAIHEKMLKAGL